MLTTLALNAAELNTSVCTEFVAPNAKLLIETPVNTINTSFNSRYLGFSVALLLVGLLVVCGKESMTKGKPWDINEARQLRVLVVEGRALMRFLRLW